MASGPKPPTSAPPNASARSSPRRIPRRSTRVALATFGNREADGFHGMFMGCYWDLVGLNADLVGFYGTLVGFNGDFMVVLVAFQWDFIGIYGKILKLDHVWKPGFEVSTRRGPHLRRFGATPQQKGCGWLAVSWW